MSEAATEEASEAATEGASGAPLGALASGEAAEATLPRLQRAQFALGALWMGGLALMILWQLHFDSRQAYVSALRDQRLWITLPAWLCVGWALAWLGLSLKLRARVLHREGQLRLLIVSNLGALALLCAHAKIAWWPALTGGDAFTQYYEIETKLSQKQAIIGYSFGFAALALSLEHALSFLGLSRLREGRERSRGLLEASSLALAFVLFLLLVNAISAEGTGRTLF